MEKINFKKLFSKLSHIRALSIDQKFDQVVQNLILYCLAQNETGIFKDENEIAEIIFNIYGIRIRTHIVQSNLDKLLSTGDLLKENYNRQIIISQVTKNKILKRIEENDELESRVKLNWLNEISANIPEIDQNDYETLWLLLNNYFCNVFEQHGMQTLQFLNPKVTLSDIDQQSISAIIDKIISENESKINKEIFISSINEFILNANEERSNYISQLADSTFTSYALTSDEETIDFLNNRFNNLILFLDTNFIFGILDLHKNSEDTSAKELLNEIKINKLPFQLKYHPETLEEFKRTFDSKALILTSTTWDPETSRVALQIDGLSPLEELYHLENSIQKIDPKIFLEKYNQVDLILKEIGLIEHIPLPKNYLESSEMEEDISEYENFYEKIPTRKNKSYYSYKHDVIVLREVRSLNPKKTKFLDCKAFFVSSDYILSKFEKDYYKKTWEVNFVVSPSVFLQLVRPFLQNDHTSNKRFIDTFTIPSIRSFDIDYSSTRSKVLQIINDNYHGVSFETKVNILRDRLLLDKFEKSNNIYEKQIKIIDDKIIIENQILKQNQQERENIIKTKEIELEKITKEKETIEINSQEEIKKIKEEKERDAEIIQENLKKQQHENIINSLNDKRKELRNLKPIKERIEEKEVKKASRYLLLLFFTLISSFILLIYTIYFNNWIKIEPIITLIPFCIFIFQYAYFLKKKKKWDPFSNYHDAKNHNIDYKEFNIEYYHNLENEINDMEDKLK